MSERSPRKPSLPWLLGITFSAGLLGAVASQAGTPASGLAMGPQSPPPVEAIFFDLGNTVFYRPPGDPAPGCPFPKLRAYDDAEQTFSALRKRGIRLGVITSVPDSWTLETLNSCLERPELLEPFEVVILSSQAPGDKPEPRIFDYAMAQLDNPPAPERIAFVTEEAEDLESTIDGAPAGAQAVGMVGFLKAPTAVAGIDEHVTTLAEIVDVLDRRQMKASP